MSSASADTERDLVRETLPVYNGPPAAARTSGIAHLTDREMRRLRRMRR